MWAKGVRVRVGKEGVGEGCVGVESVQGRAGRFHQQTAVQWQARGVYSAHSLDC